MLLLSPRISLAEAKRTIPTEIDHCIFFDDPAKVLLIGKEIYYFEDKTNHLDIDEVSRLEFLGRFKPSIEEVFVRPANTSAYWFLVNIRNASEDDLWINAGGNLSCWYVDIYEVGPAESYRIVSQTGAMRPGTTLYPSNFYWQKLIDKGDTSIHRFLLKYNGSFPHEYPIEVGSFQSLIKEKDKMDLMAFGYAGFLLAMLLYNCFLAYSTKEIIYVYYSLYLIFGGGTVPFNNNYFFFDVTGWWRDHFFIWYNLSFLSIGLFSINYLNTKEIAPRIHRLIVLFVAILSVGLPLLTLIGIPIVQLMSFFQITGSLFFLLLFGTAFYSWKIGHKRARFYVLGWAFVIVSYFVLVLTLNGIIPFNIYTRNAMYYGVSCEILFFSLALGERLRLLQEEKEEALKDAIRLSKQVSYQAAFKRDLESKILRSQFNPHFVFNSLNSIQFLIASRNVPHALDYLRRFSILLRTNMEMLDRGEIPLFEEIENMRRYVELESLRLDEPITLEVNYQDIKLETILVPSFILQPVIQNSILHGLIPKKGNPRIWLDLNLQGKAIVVTVRDNGIGLKASRSKSNLEKPIPNHIFGLDLTRARLAQLTSEHSDSLLQAKEWSDGDAFGTIVTLKITFKGA